MAQIKHLTTKTGVEAVADVVTAFEVVADNDGLTFAAPDDIADSYPQGITLSSRLLEFFADLRVLRRVPLTYLVPDSRLLPPESIRFFHVNQTWIDRVIDGVVSNTNLGTVDFHRSLPLLQTIRNAVPRVPDMTGMLIRSELVRRWPTMIVRAYSATNPTPETAIPILRSEPVSRDIFIAIFASEPKTVHLREPFDGVRYGVEVVDPDADELEHVVDGRNQNGEAQGGPIPVELSADRVIDVAALAAATGVPTSRSVALHLEQRPYVQVFRSTTGESTGSTAPAQDEQGNPILTLRNGRTVKLSIAPDWALFGPDAPD
jgi:hypothetical protein